MVGREAREKKCGRQGGRGDRVSELFGRDGKKNGLAGDLP